MAYPKQTQWQGEDLADGETRLVGVGSVLSDYRESYDTREYADSKEWGSSQNQEGVKNIIFNLKYTRLVSVPIINGSSGSSNFDDYNEICGINSFTQATEEDPKLGSSYMLLASEAKKYVENSFSWLDTEAVFIDLHKSFPLLV